jgi:exopolysaccharide biosynthesis polyprenyl glycosylphosphotransferase
MLLVPSDKVLTKRRLINYLVGFESVLLVLLTALAVNVRNMGIDLKASDSLAINLLLFSFPVMWLCCLSIFGAWNISILDNHFEGYRRLMKSSLMTFLTFSSASYLFKIQISRFVILFSLVGGTLLHLLLRWIFLDFVERKKLNKRIANKWLVVSKGKKIDHSVEHFVSQTGGQATYTAELLEGQDFLKWVKELTLHVELGKFDKVVLTSTATLSASQIQALIWSVQQTGSELLIRDDIGLATSKNHFEFYGGHHWLSIGFPQINDSLRVIKRIFDLVVVTPALILTLPLFVFIGLAVRIDSHGPIFFNQKRVGQNGKLFVFPKFRTMYQNSEEKRLDFLGRPDANMVERYKTDPRITKVGKVLRRYSLDELPQLWCVFLGSMSLVGPRPILPQEESQLGDFDFRRHIAKPGLTGIWQVSGRKETSWEERMAFDIKYVQEWSLALDLILITKTFKAIISGHGSY